MTERRRSHPFNLEFWNFQRATLAVCLTVIAIGGTAAVLRSCASSCYATAGKVGMQYHNTDTVFRTSHRAILDSHRVMQRALSDMQRDVALTRFYLEESLTPAQRERAIKRMREERMYTRRMP